MQLLSAVDPGDSADGRELSVGHIGMVYLGGGGGELTAANLAEMGREEMEDGFVVADPEDVLSSRELANRRELAMADGPFTAETLNEMTRDARRFMVRSQTLLPLAAHAIMIG
jgi:hypothetical protein